MYTPCTLFSRLFLQIYFFVLSVYTTGRLVTLCCEMWNKVTGFCNSLSFASTVAKYGLCIHKSDDALHSYGHLKFSQNVRMGPEVGRWSVGRSSIFILLTLISYTPLSERSDRRVKTTQLCWVFYTWLTSSTVDSLSVKSITVTDLYCSRRPMRPWQSCLPDYCGVDWQYT